MRPNNDSCHQVKLCVVDNVDAFGNSCALEIQQWLAALDGISVRAALRSRAQLDNTNARNQTRSPFANVVRSLVVFAALNNSGRTSGACADA